MTDREKVINELIGHIESALAVDSDYVDCIRTDLLQTAVHMLTEQDTVEHALDVLRAHGWKDETEPVKPKRVLGVLPDWYHCGACGVDMLDTGDGYRPKYCPNCGRAVKWDEAIQEA